MSHTIKDKIQAQIYLNSQLLVYDDDTDDDDTQRET
jgi:hypothetical protein